MNIELFEEVLNHIKAHPEQHDQSTWHSACGTKHCFAGWAELLALPRELQSLSLKERTMAVGYGACTLYNAMRALEITSYEAEQLFYPDVTMKDLENFLARKKAKLKLRQALDNFPSGESLRPGNAPRKEVAEV